MRCSNCEYCDLTFAVTLTASGCSVSLTDLSYLTTVTLTISMAACEVLSQPLDKLLLISFYLVFISILHCNYISSSLTMDCLPPSPSLLSLFCLSLVSPPLSLPPSLSLAMLPTNRYRVCAELLSLGDAISIVSLYRCCLLLG